MFEIQGQCNTAKVFAKELEKSAISEIHNLLKQSFASGSQIRFMPDAHAGMGCVIGTTMTIKDKIVPNLVGVDISCGVEAVNIGNCGIDFEKLDAVIRQRIPSGFAIRDHSLPFFSSTQIVLDNLSCVKDMALGKAAKAIGTLGGGNHFIEIDKDDNGDFWLVIHSGSRNLGYAVANYHQKLAQALHDNVPKDLAWLDGSLFDAYVNDMKIIQQYAHANRLAMTLEIMDGMEWKEKDRFTTVHNYLDTNNMILRKGAVSAQKGERLLIPINMRDGTLLCEGLGNPDWNFSAPHGAGRLMSRGEAKRNLSLDNFHNEMNGIFTTSVNENTLDEAPGAYKPMQNILDCIGETAKVISILKPVYNFKAAEVQKRKRGRR